MLKSFIPPLDLLAASQQSTLWFIFQQERLLLCHGQQGMELPQLADIAHLQLTIQRQHYLGAYNAIPCYVAEVAEQQLPPTNMLFQPLRSWEAFNHNEDLFLIASRAKQILTWDKLNQYCGQCGNKTAYSATERAKHCGYCATLVFPQVAPVALALVFRNNEILLARSAHFLPGLYSILAGFVEPGETLEQTVAREVKEEVGITIKNLSYFGSQPWPFPSNLMLGFMAEYADGEIIRDPVEIEDAQWFSLETLPSLPTPRSLSRQMINAFINSRLKPGYSHE